MRPNVDPPELDDALRDFLLTREYAGNVRDLKQLVAGLVYRYSGRGTITPGYLDDVERPDKPELMDWRDEGFDRAIRVAVARGVTLREIGRAAADSAIRVAFDQTGSLQGAARRLGVTDRALQMRRKKGESAVRLPVEEEHSVATLGALLSPSPGDVSLPSYKTDELKG
jgi:transcriptional regulator with PAS, ATPase and Fis domain